MLHAVVMVIVNVADDSTPRLDLRDSREFRSDPIRPRPPATDNVRREADGPAALGAARELANEPR